MRTRSRSQVQGGPEKPPRATAGQSPRGKTKLAGGPGGENWPGRWQPVEGGRPGWRRVPAGRAREEDRAAERRSGRAGGLVDGAAAAVGGGLRGTGGAGLGGSAPDRRACHREGPAAGPQRDPLTNMKPNPQGRRENDRRPGGHVPTAPVPGKPAGTTSVPRPSRRREIGLDCMGPGGGRMPVISRAFSER